MEGILTRALSNNIAAPVVQRDLFEWHVDLHHLAFATNRFVGIEVIEHVVGKIVATCC